MPEKYLRKTLRIRFFLDILAAFVFFLKREKSNVKAVFNARKEFRKNKKQYEQIRKDNLSKSLMDLPPQIYSKSIIFAFYCRNKQKFSELNI